MSGARPEMETETIAIDVNWTSKITWRLVGDTWSSETKTTFQTVGLFAYDVEAFFMQENLELKLALKMKSGGYDIKQVARCWEDYVGERFFMLLHYAMKWRVNYFRCFTIDKKLYR